VHIAIFLQECEHSDCESMQGPQESEHSETQSVESIQQSEHSTEQSDDGGCDEHTDDELSERPVQEYSEDEAPDLTPIQTVEEYTNPVEKETKTVKCHTDRKDNNNSTLIINPCTPAKRARNFEDNDIPFTTSTARKRKRLGKFPFSHKDKFELLEMYQNEPQLHFSGTNFDSCKWPSKYDELALKYNKGGVQCTGAQLFNGIKNMRKIFTYYLKSAREVGRELTVECVSKDKLYHRAIVSAFLDEAESIPSRNRPIKEVGSFTL